jgi:hypothetical protein
MDAELIVNLWAIYDSGTGFIYGLSGRAYFVKGTETEKLSLLHRLSATDYITAKRYEVPDRFQVIYADGSVQRKVTLLQTVYDPNSQLFEEMFKNIESELSQIPDFSGEEYRSVPQQLPKDPLCVVTILYEDELGNIRPIITDEDREWLAEQVKAHGRELLAGVRVI